MIFVLPKVQGFQVKEQKENNTKFFKGQLTEDTTANTQSVLPARHLFSQSNILGKYSPILTCSSHLTAIKASFSESFIDGCNFTVNSSIMDLKIFPIGPTSKIRQLTKLAFKVYFVQDWHHCMDFDDCKNVSTSPLK
uniref:Uncharacterized protein n=1 Tax=Glossina austeni TaxID=7395 RepID=A0A1A9VAJ3_GLOAU